MLVFLLGFIGCCVCLGRVVWVRCGWLNVLMGCISVRWC